MQITAFVDVLSHWCLAAQPTLSALRHTLADDVELEVVLAPLGDGQPVGFTHAQEAWFYRRGTLAYGTALKADWCENPDTTTWHANAAAAAAIAHGVHPVTITAAVSKAAMVDGRLLGREDEAVRVVAGFTRIGEDALRSTMRSNRLVEQLHAGNKRLAAIGCFERPSWELRNDNGDVARLQGVWQAEAILPLARAMLEDERAYARAGTPPP